MMRQKLLEELLEMLTMMPEEEPSKEEDPLAAVHGKKPDASLEVLAVGGKPGQKMEEDDEER